MWRQVKIFHADIKVNGRLKSSSYYSSVKKRLHCDVRWPAYLLPPIVPTASPRSQEPTPSWRTRLVRAPTHKHSRSDSGPPRWSCRRQPRTACGTHGWMWVLDNKTHHITLQVHKYMPHLPSAFISPARPGFGWIQSSGYEWFFTQRVDGDQGEQCELLPFLLQKHRVFSSDLSFFFLRGAEQLMLQQDK